MSEDMPSNPLSPYALQKLVGEQFAGMYARLYGMTIVSLRYFNVYGPRQPFRGPYALVNREVPAPCPLRPPFDHIRGWRADPLLLSCERRGEGEPLGR